MSFQAQLRADAAARRASVPGLPRLGPHPADVAAGTPKPKVPRSASESSSLILSPIRRNQSPSIGIDGSSDSPKLSVATEATEGPGEEQRERSRRMLFPQATCHVAAPEREASFRAKKRHYFIISNSGRPIYSRHGAAHEASSVAAAIFGYVSMAHDAIGVA
jgi:vacuolar fusion protein MON1